MFTANVQLAYYFPQPVKWVNKCSLAVSFCSDKTVIISKDGE